MLSRVTDLTPTRYFAQGGNKKKKKFLKDKQRHCDTMLFTAFSWKYGFMEPMQPIATRTMSLLRIMQNQGVCKREAFSGLI